MASLGWDSFFDENEGRYYITQQSVNRAVEEERARHTASSNQQPPEKELPHDAKASYPQPAEASHRRYAESSEQMKELERQNRDLEIATRAKDYYLEQLQKERAQHVEQLVGMSRYVGELETQLLGLGGAPRGDRTLPKGAESLRKILRNDDPTPQAEQS